MENKITIILIIIIIVLILAITGRLIYIRVENIATDGNDVQTVIKQENEIIELTEEEKAKFNELFSDYIFGTWLKEDNNIVFGEIDMIEFAVLISNVKYQNKLAGSDEKPYSKEFGKVKDTDPIYVLEEDVSEIVKKYFNTENLKFSMEMSANYHPSIRAFEIYNGLGGYKGVFKANYMERTSDDIYIVYASHFDETVETDIKLMGNAKFYFNKITENEEERYCFIKVEYELPPVEEISETPNEAQSEISSEVQ